jgi:hypothetical protein
MSEADLQGVSFSAELPLSWEALTEQPPFTLQGWMLANVAMLRGLATMEAMQGDKENELGPVAGKALERLEAKIDLSLTLLARLLANRSDFPPTLPITLSPDFIEWVEEKGPETGREVLLSLYLSRALPTPLLLPARVVASERRPGGTHTRAVFIRFSEEMEDWLERTVFRHHRRAIHARLAQQEGTIT